MLALDEVRIMEEDVFFEIRRDKKGNYKGNFRCMFKKEMLKVASEVHKTELEMILENQDDDE